METLLGPLALPTKGIRENLDEGYIEFYVAGYTKSCKDLSVQCNHRLLFESSPIKVEDPKQTREFPFGFFNSPMKVYLEPEPLNTYDPTALIVKLNAPMYTNIKGLFYLGYVPHSISSILTANLDKIDGGCIKKVRMHSTKTGPRFVAKVAFQIKGMTKVDSNSFAAHILRILEDLD
jgi:hypothetical protein